MQSENEKELLKQIKKDPQAFALLYDEHYHSIFSYVFRRLANYDVARDVVAETFLKAFQKIGHFKWKNIPVSAWLYRIATNEINLHFRRLKKNQTCDLDINLYLPYEPGIETEKAALEKALAESIEFLTMQEQLLLLDIKYQEVIALRFFEDKNIKEISAILNKKEGTIKSLLSRGLEKLRMGKLQATSCQLQARSEACSLPLIARRLSATFLNY
jgi:RNA polymerase sigma-70 factor (ECF subfamily)